MHYWKESCYPLAEHRMRACGNISWMDVGESVYVMPKERRMGNQSQCLATIQIRLSGIFWDLGRGAERLNLNRRIG
jgi:hypothetical protein